MVSTELVGSAEACEAIGVDRSTLIRWVKAGKATAVQRLPGQTGVYLFEPAEIARLVAEQAREMAS
jgi:predicted site-specific integrase-resolvase